MSAEEIAEKDFFVQEERIEEEGSIKNFFKKIFGFDEKEEKEPDHSWASLLFNMTSVVCQFFNPDVPEPEETPDEEETGPPENWDGEPFVEDGKLYGQDYDSIKERLLGKGKKFVDPWFPANSKSLFYTSPAPRLEWKRPHDLTSNPELFVDGADRFDINQGELGDCWLLAAMSSLAMNHNLFHKVLIQGQSFNEDDYAGIFKFRFWQYGEWVEVVVDDFLPTINGKLSFIHSDSRNEFWGALMEKAYAKLHGSYEALKGGSTCEAMVDFTGGCGEVFDLSKPPDNLFSILLHCYKRKSMNGCSIQADPNIHEAKTEQGLVKGHAYTITKVMKPKISTGRKTGRIPLVRVRNPWGNSTEWNGTWSDSGGEWGFISDEQKEAMGIVFDNDGEWWMSYKDFVQYYDQLEICHLSPDCLDHCEGDAPKWQVNNFHGSWINGQSAGGCRNFLDTFCENPQFLVELGANDLALDDDERDEDELDGRLTLIVSLMQKNRRAMRHTGMGYLSVGFVIYRLKDFHEYNGQMDMDFFKYNLSVTRSKSFINQREVTLRVRLEPGRYLIVPSTYEPGFEGEFLLRTFCEQ